MDDPEHTDTTAPVSAPRAEEPALAPGTRLAGRYTVLDVLGRGGMGAVYAVYDDKLDRRVALKLLHARVARDPDGQAGQRLLREAQAMARLNHPNVVSVYDVGQLADGQLFLALELVEGQTLRQWLQTAAPRWRQILDVFIAAGRGLEAVHAAGLVHRDFKPANVLVGRDGRARVTDFGVVRVHQADAPSAPRPPADGPATPAAADERWRSSTTEAGTIAGTPRYMAPEIFDGRPADQRSDLYSFCLALYEALYHQHPFADDPTRRSPLDALPRADVPMPPLTTPVPLWVGRAVVAGLRLDPQARPPSMGVLLATLARDPREQRARWLQPLVAVGLVAIVAGVVTAAWRSQKAGRAQLCAGAAQQLAGVWDDAARHRVEAAMLATRQPFAAHAWHNLSQTLDRYADGWTQMHRDACIATRLRGDQSDAVLTLRMACLEQRRQSLAAVVEVLGQADVAVVERAEQAATGLPSLERCADVPALLAEVPPPEDAAERARVQALRAQLARVAPLRLAGRAGDAGAIAARALATARTLGYAPVLAEALLESASVAVQAAPAKAVPLLTEAVWTAQAHRDDRVAAAAAVGLVEAYGLLNQPKDWKTWQDYATAALRRIGGDGELEAQLWSALGQCTREQGAYSESLDAYEHAASLMAQRYGSRDVRTLQEERSALAAINNIGREAEAHARKLPLLARTEEVLGPQHPMLARMLVSVAFSDDALGYFADTQKVLGRAAAILRDLGDDDSARWSSWYVVASDLALRQGHYAETQAVARRGIALHEKLGMRTNTAALSLIGDLYLAGARAGSPGPAIAALEDELRRAESSTGDNNPALESLFISLADSYEVAGQRDKALALRERYVALMGARNPPHSGQVAAAQLELERSLAWARPDEVLRRYDQDNQQLVATTGPQALVLLRVRMVRGEALLARGQAGAAAAELEGAVRVGDAGGYDPNLRARLRGELARARLALDANAKTAAAALVAEAERDYEQSEHADPRARAALERWARSQGLRWR